MLTEGRSVPRPSDEPLTMPRPGFVLPPLIDSPRMEPWLGFSSSCIDVPPLPSLLLVVAPIDPPPVVAPPVVVLPPLVVAPPVVETPMGVADEELLDELLDELRLDVLEDGGV